MTKIVFYYRNPAESYKGGELTPGDETRLAQTLRNKLEAGYCIAIMGWKDSNHDAFTRNLPREFVFFDDAPKIVPKQVGYALITRFVSHDETKRVRKQVHSHPKLFTIGHIRRLLKEASQEEPTVTKTALTQPTPFKETEIMTRASILSSAITPDSSENTAGPGEKEKELAFALAFCKAVDHNPDGMLTKYEVNKILRQHFGEKANGSAYKSLLEPVVKEGKQKAGSYKATKYLLELATHVDTEPTDPIEKVRWLIAQKPKLEQRHKKLTEEMVVINRDLDRIRKAEDIFNGLRKV